MEVRNVQKFLYFFQKFWVIILIVVGFVIGMGTFLIVRVTTSSINSSNTDNSSLFENNSKPTKNKSKKESVSKSTNKQFVEIKGAVVKPGIYPIQTNMRLAAVLTKAGGATPDADLKNINLAKIVKDQDSFYIPQKGENPVGAIESSSVVNNTIGNENAPSKNSEQKEQVDLNTADVSKLQTLDGIGQKKAEKIIEYRKEHGNFKEITDLKKISGIGDKIFNAIKDRILVSD